MELLSDAARDAGRAVVIVTHDTRIFDYADHLIELEDGLVIRDEALRTEEEAGSVAEPAPRPARKAAA